MAGKKGQKKRFWSKDEKHLIFAQARVAGFSVAQVARWYSMNANLIHKWLRAPWFATDFSDDTLKIEGVASSLVSIPPPALEAPLSVQRVDIKLPDGRRIWGRRDGIACKCCERIVRAPLPSRPIERGRPGVGLLAHGLVNKYADHCPLYRQSQIFAREGIDLDRSTLAGWVGQSLKLLEPLADAIGRYVRSGQAIFADDTPIKMHARKRCATARIWTYVRDERPWNSHWPLGVSSARTGKASIPPITLAGTRDGSMQMATSQDLPLNAT